MLVYTYTLSSDEDPRGQGTGTEKDFSRRGDGENFNRAEDRDKHCPRRNPRPHGWLRSILGKCASRLFTTFSTVIEKKVVCSSPQFLASFCFVQPKVAPIFSANMVSVTGMSLGRGGA